MVQPPRDPAVRQPAEMREFYQAWQDVIVAIDQLQETYGRTREALTEMTPELALAPESSRMLDQFLYLERLAIELGRIADDARRGSDELVSDVDVE